MTTIEEIKSFLDGLGTLGTIKMSFMPHDPDVIGCLYEYPGQMPQRQFGTVGVMYERPALQLVFRGAAFDYLGPRVKSEIAYRAFVAVQPGALSGSISTKYLQIDPLQPPFQLGSLDANNRVRIAFNFYPYRSSRECSTNR